MIVHHASESLSESLKRGDYETRKNILLTIAYRNMCICYTPMVLFKVSFQVCKLELDIIPVNHYG